MLVSYHARTAVVSSEVRRGSLSTDVAHTRRPTIKIMCLSKGRKHAGSRTERNMVELGLYVTSKTLAVVSKLLFRGNQEDATDGGV